MNKYPMWKYAIIAIALLVSCIYAAPNLFGEVPAVQVSGAARHRQGRRARCASTLEDALKGANVTVTDSEMSGDSLRYLFADTDTQIRARDAIQSKVGPQYVVALNLVPASPHWLQALGSKPMYLGLDLRGGVHFLLQVDMNAAKTKSVERYMGDARGPAARQEGLLLRHLARRPSASTSASRSPSSARGVEAAQRPDVRPRDPRAGVGRRGRRSWRRSSPRWSSASRTWRCSRTSRRCATA
jgi:preprotein translocase subunit SecD